MYTILIFLVGAPLVDIEKGWKRAAVVCTSTVTEVGIYKRKQEIKKTRKKERKQKKRFRE